MVAVMNQYCALLFRKTPVSLPSLCLYVHEAVPSQCQPFLFFPLWNACILFVCTPAVFSFCFGFAFMCLCFYFPAWVFDSGDLIMLICCMKNVMARHWQDGGQLEFLFWWRFIVLVFPFPVCCDLLHIFPASILSHKYVPPREFCFSVMF